MSKKKASINHSKKNTHKFLPKGYYYLLVISTYLLPLILNQASAHCLWAAAKSSLQEHPSSMGVPDSWLVISMLRWQILQSLSTLVKCTLTSGTTTAPPSSRSTSTEHSDAEDPLCFSDTPTISVPESGEDPCWSSSDRSPAAELRWQPLSMSTATWNLSSVISILNTQVENLHVMTQRGKISLIPPHPTKFWRRKFEFFWTLAEEKQKGWYELCEGYYFSVVVGWWISLFWSSESLTEGKRERDMNQQKMLCKRNSIMNYAVIWWGEIWQKKKSTPICFVLFCLFLCKKEKGYWKSNCVCVSRYSF